MLRAALNDGNVATYLNWTDNTGHALFKEISLEIGGQEIDKQYGHWMSVWHDLTKSVDTDPAYNALVGNVDELTALRPADTQGNFTRPYYIKKKKKK
jgi:hypothetical protein